MTVLVVGAGPTGLALACGLLEGGGQVRIVDAAPGPAGSPVAIALAADSSRVSKTGASS